ncbi:MAG: MOSC domain-containing protein [Acidimicrobiia bacterium]
MFAVGPHRFSRMDARKTFVHLDALWGQLTEGRDESVAAPVAAALASTFAATLGVPASAPHDDALLDRLGGIAAAALASGSLRDEQVVSLLDAVMSGLAAGSDALRAAGQLPATVEGSARHLHLSDGGVPKQAREAVEIGFGGVVGDRQKTRLHHGRPWQALCIWSAEVIEALRAEGHPVTPGAAGENITVAGLEWADVRAGVRLRIGTALAQASVFALPCRNIAFSFLDRDMGRIHHERGPVSRVYATVLEPGHVSAGDPVVLEPAP